MTNSNVIKRPTTMKTWLIFSALCCLLSPLAAHADHWLCIGDKSAGFLSDDGAWKETTFEPEKFLIKPASGYREGAKLQVHHFGREIPSYLCMKEFGTKGANLLVCGGHAVPGDTFKFNKATGNFLATKTMGYVQTEGGKLVTDSIEIIIGKCSKL